MHVLRADGRIGVISGWKIVPGVKTMYNLEVAQDHTYTVGTGEWVVHNCANPDELPPSFKTKTLTTDAYRSGNPDKLDLTLGPADVDKAGNVKMGPSNGLSHFDRPVDYFEGKNIYKISAGTEAPDGFQWSYKWNSRMQAYHIGLQPIEIMSQGGYESTVEGIQSLYGPLSDSP